MRFDLDKYDVLVMEKEVREKSVRTGLHSVEKIGEIDQDLYKYLRKKRDTTEWVSGCIGSYASSVVSVVLRGDLERFLTLQGSVKMVRLRFGGIDSLKLP